VTVRCPTCGAEVEFRYDDSFVRVCGHCRAAVVRTDRGAETLGQFADLMPMSSALRLFAEGRYGTTGFLLIGMAQLKHAAGGVWQEWYAKLDGGQWAWISEAQGRIYLTFERPDVPVPSIAALAPGTQTPIAGAPFTVAERGTATYVSAQGEIPYRLVPNSTFQFADLSDGRGGFATIDYGDGSDAPAVYVGYQVTPQGLGLSGGEAAPQLVTPATGARLACPNCNGALELRVPDQTLRVACPYCNSLVSVEGGALAIIAKQAKKPVIAIALGSKATLGEGELTVVGYVGRSAYVDGSWWPFEEYLLHAPGVGFRWLVCSDGHWSYVQPVASGAVSVGAGASYDGVAFRRFQTADLRVDSVLGEFYWRVTAGERVHSEDFIAPPAMLSREASAQEENWSLSSYLTTSELDHAFGKKLGLPVPIGVGPNQPYAAGIAKVSALVFVAFFAVGIGKCASAPAAEKLRAHFAIPTQSATPRSAVDPSLGVVPSSDPALDALAAGSAQPTLLSEPAGAVMFSDKFQLDGGKNVRFDLQANVNDNWAYAALDLVNDDTGGVVSFDKSIEYYSGFDSDGSWSEGSRTADEVIGPVERGTYMLRVEAQHGGTGDVDLGITVRQGVFRWIWFWIALGVLAVPFGLVAAHASAFRKRRWQNSNVVAHTSFSIGGDDDD
jgi:Domain of unknown function (DUF4178)